MRIYKQDDKLIVELPLTQHKSNMYDENEKKELTDNLIGVVNGKGTGFEECMISQLIDLSYKGDQQEGMPYIHFFGDAEEFEELCKTIGISVWYHDICAKCNKVLYGCFTVNDNGEYVHEKCL